MTEVSATAGRSRRIGIGTDREQLERALLANLRFNGTRLRRLLDEVSGPKVYDRLIYKAYTGSYKASWLAQRTGQITAALAALAPGATPLNPLFMEILQAGAIDPAEAGGGAGWLGTCGRAATAFLHAKYFLEMAVKVAEAADPVADFGVASAWQGLSTLYRI